MSQGFIRRTWNKYSKLGRRRKKKQIWRRPTGRHNKMREKRKGRPKVVSIGYGSNKNNREKIEGKNQILIKEISQLEKMKKNEIAVIGKVGKKRKIDLAKKAVELKIELYNLNPNQYLKKNSLKEKVKEKTNKEIKK